MIVYQKEKGNVILAGNWQTADSQLGKNNFLREETLRPEPFREAFDPII